MTIPTELIAETTLEFPCPPLARRNLRPPMPSAWPACSRRWPTRSASGFSPGSPRIRAGKPLFATSRTWGVPAHGQPPPEEAERGRPDHLRAPRHLGVLPGRAGGTARDGPDAGAYRLAPYYASVTTTNCSPGASSRHGRGYLRADSRFLAAGHYNFLSWQSRTGTTTPRTDGPAGIMAASTWWCAACRCRIQVILIGQVPEPAALAWIRHGAGLPAGARRRASRCPPARTGSPSARSGCARSSRARTSRTRSSRRGSGLVAFGSFTFDDWPPRALCSSCPARCSAGTARGTPG